MKLVVSLGNTTWTCATCVAKASRIGRLAFSRRNAPFQPHSRKLTSTAKQSTIAVARDGKLPDYPARTRFAPSPTGYMHIGGLRTALFSYLLAKRTGGQFILRIEDTDQKRLVPDAVDRLCEDLCWAGLQWDEGPEVGGPYGPYQQSDRNDICQRHAELLLEGGCAYRCFCTPQTSAAGAGSAAFVTSGCYQSCSHLPLPESRDRARSGEYAFTVRLKATSDARTRLYPDLIYGNIKRLKRSASTATDENSVLDGSDTILLKSDGTPTYHFANVVDDHLMKITHVIRGTEWMASTPLHYDLYNAFGWKPPVFAHVGLLLDRDKAKLSKRNADLALDVRGLRDDHGVLPETLCNFLALQGWSNPRKSDVMTMDDLVENFDLKFTRGNTMVLMEKLWFLQKSHVQLRCERVRNGEESALSEIVDKVAHEVRVQYSSFAAKLAGDELASFCKNVLLADDKSYHNARQFVSRNWYFFSSAAVVKARTDASAESISDSIPLESIQELLVDLAQGYDEAMPYRESQANTQERSAGTAARGYIDESNIRIHAFIDTLIWKRLAPPAFNAKELPFTDKPINISAVAESFAHNADAMQIVKQNKDWQKSVMKYLRLKLAAGTPGPGVGMVMAVLGYAECCERLGVEAVEGKSW